MSIEYIGFPITGNTDGLVKVGPSRDLFIRSLTEAIAYNDLTEFFLVETTKGKRTLRYSDLPKLTSQYQLEPDWERVRQENRGPASCTERQRIFLALMLHMYNPTAAAKTIKREFTLHDCVCMMQGNDATNRCLWNSLIAFYPGW
jgi:hypothetical protein